MAIPISDLIKVDIAVSPNSVSTDGYGPLVFMTKQFQPVAAQNAILVYTSMAAVEADYPSGEIFNAATAWYSQKPTPKTFCVGSLNKAPNGSPTSGQVWGGGAAVLADLVKITSGSMLIYIDGNANNITGINLSAAKSFDDVVTTLNSHIKGGVFQQTNGTFAIKSSTTGVGSTVSMPMPSDLATALKLTSATGATISAGASSYSVSDDLSAMSQAATATKQSFFYVAVEKSFRDTQQILDFAVWAEANNKVFGLCSSSASVLVAGDTANMFAQAKAKNFQRTINVYDASGGNEYPEISILGRAATVNFNVAGSSLILAFKKGPSITTANLTPTQLKALQSYNGNAFIDVGGNTMFWNGVMADGTWFDTVQGISWLTQKVQVNVFNLFYGATTKIPFTETGVAMVNQQVTLALELAVTNGLVAPGYDSEGTFYPKGYKVISTDISLLQSDKGTRLWEGTSFIAIGAGALQGATISGSFVQ